MTKLNNVEYIDLGDIDELSDDEDENLEDEEEKLTLEDKIEE